jgi:hypothetical protein
MANIQNASSYTYSPSYTYPGNLPVELYRKPSIMTPALSEMFNIRQNVRTDEYLVLVGQLEKLLKAATGCNPTYGTSGQFTDRKLSVGKFEANQQWCKSDFIATASALTNDPTFVGNGLDGYEVSAKVRSVWMDEMVDAIRRDIWRITLFGNDASGSADYNVIDGLLVKLLDAFASYCVKAIGNDFPNQYNSVLAADQAYDALKKVHTNSSTILKQLPNSEKIFWVTGSVYENLMASYESKTNGATETQFRYITDGVGDKLTYRGIEVKPLYIADNYFEDSANPWYNNMRHFIIYTTRGGSKFANLVFGTESASDLDKIEMFYQQKDKATYSQYESRFGVQFIQCDLTSIYH